MVTWEYQFEWKMNWGITLDPPWRSTYANARFSTASAMLYRLTGEDRYRDLAVKAARFIGTPMSAGGGEYEVAGFRLPAEYIYNTPPLPNVRVLDGEMITVTSLYDTARLLADSEILNVFLRQSGSLAMQLESYTRPDGSLEFSMYINDMPQAYRWSVWSMLQVLANQSKDRRFADVARNYAAHVPQDWKEANGY